MTRIAVIAHVYYRSLWPELLAHIRNITGDRVDVFLTVVEAGLVAEVQRDIPESTVKVIENGGYDILPFIQVINDIKLQDYDLVVKLHTKRDCDDWVNCWPIFGSRWRKRLLSFSASSRCWEKVVRCFDDKRTGMVAHGSLIVGSVDKYWELQTCLSLAKSEVRRLVGVDDFVPEFVAGTMFVVRSSLLQPLQGNVAPEMFRGDMNHQIGKAAHSYERVLGYLVKAQGLKIVDFAHILWLYRATEFLRLPIFLIARWSKRLVLHAINKE